MAILFNWWRNIWLNHIKRTITHERIRVTAEDVGLIPQLTIIWTVENRSMADIVINSISGQLNIGAWRVAIFGSSYPQKKMFGYDWSPAVTVTKLKLKKSDRAEVNIVVFPPIEFWIKENYNCILRNTIVEVKSFWGKVRTEVKSNDHLKIENVERVALGYQDKMNNRLVDVFNKLKGQKK